MKEQFCQSCGMDMVASKEAYGTNADGSINNAYCHYCYSEGKFTSDLSMNEMIDQWVTYMVSEDKNITESDARNKMEAFIPTLKRWQK